MSKKICRDELLGDDGAGASDFGPQRIAIGTLGRHCLSAPLVVLSGASATVLAVLYLTTSKVRCL